MSIQSLESIISTASPINKKIGKHFRGEENLWLDAY